MKISQTDANAFELGRNLATTPGKVVFQNDLMQLIQYTPTTDKVRERPLLMVPPWINKYYILDLTGPKSFIRYAVDQGFTVFVVSWVNPDERLAAKTFEDYILEGILEAVRAVQEETGVEKINVLGYCVGGTALSTGLAYLAQRGEEPFKCCTLLATQVDFSLAGDLLLFTDDTQLDSLETLMTQRGFLDGSRMANVFNMMRPRDLIWPYVVNNYLLGKKPFPFDLLFWNQDSTRMAAANHGFYLREFYNENRLARGEMTIGGVKLDLKKITLPIFSVATARRSHRSGGVGFPRRADVRRSRRDCACGFRPHRRHHQSARQSEVSVLDEGHRHDEHCRLASIGGGISGLVVAILDRMAFAAGWRLDPQAGARRHARRYRGCARLIRQSPLIVANVPPEALAFMPTRIRLRSRPAIER